MARGGGHGQGAGRGENENIFVLKSTVADYAMLSGVCLLDAAVLAWLKDYEDFQLLFTYAGSIIFFLAAGSYNSFRSREQEVQPDLKPVKLFKTIRASLIVLTPFSLALAGYCSYMALNSDHDAQRYIEAGIGLGVMSVVHLLAVAISYCSERSTSKYTPIPENYRQMPQTP